MPAGVAKCGNSDIRGQRTRSGEGSTSLGRRETFREARRRLPCLTIKDSACARVLRMGEGLCSGCTDEIHAPTCMRCVQCTQHATETGAAELPGPTPACVVCGQAPPAQQPVRVAAGHPRLA